MSNHNQPQTTQRTGNAKYSKRQLKKELQWRHKERENRDEDNKSYYVKTYAQRVEAMNKRAAERLAQWEAEHGN